MTLAQAQKRIEAIADRLSEAMQEAYDLKEELETVFGDRSDKWQESDKGQSWTEQIDAVEEWADAISSVNDDRPDVTQA